MSDKLYQIVMKTPAWVQILIFIAIMVVGVFFLVKASDVFVDGSSAIAKKLKVSSLIIGLTVVAIGTSLPELAVSVSDSITTLFSGENANIALGNVVGSNICNLLIVLGFACLFTPIAIKKSVLKREFPFLLGVTLLAMIFAIFFGLNGELVSNFAITRWEGIILVVLIFVYISFLIYNAKKYKKAGLVLDDDDSNEKLMSTPRAIIYVVLGAVFIALGGEMVVFAAKGFPKTICTELKLPNETKDLIESLVGLTIVAVGTSLPELVTSFIAAKKGENEMALGNVIGSNIFNIVFVLGISATVNPLTTGSQIIVDVLVMMGVTILVFIFSLSGKLKREHGIALLAIYVAYVAYLVTRTLIAA